MIELIERGQAQDALMDFAVIISAIGAAMGEKSGTQKFIRELERAAGSNGHAEIPTPDRMEEIREEGIKEYPWLFKQRAKRGR